MVNFPTATKPTTKKNKNKQQSHEKRKKRVQKMDKKRHLTLRDSMTIENYKNHNKLSKRNKNSFESKELEKSIANYISKYPQEFRDVTLELSRTEMK